MKKNKIIAAIIAVITLVLIYQSYTSEYNIKNDDADIERTIREFTTPFENSRGVREPFVIRKIQVDNKLLVFYGDKTVEGLFGFTPLNKGLNGKYQIRRTNYGGGINNISHYAFETSKGNYIAVGGSDYSQLISEYKLYTWNDKLILSDKVDGNTFLNIHKVNSEADFLKTKLFNSNGKDITRELRNDSNDVPGAGVGKAELFLLNVYILIISIVGFIISKYYWGKVS